MSWQDPESTRQSSSWKSQHCRPRRASSKSSSTQPRRLCSTMRLGLAYCGIGFLLPMIPNEASAQRVLIHHATPAAVLEVLKADLLPQGFKLGDAGKDGVL